MASKIVKAEQSHLYQIMMIERKVLGDANREIIRRFIHQGDVYIIFRHNKVIGSCTINKRKDTTAVRIHTLVIDPDFGRQGLGTDFINFIPTISDEFSEIRMEIREDNEQVIKFCEKNGFVKSGKRKNYFYDGCNALKMVKPIEVKD